jgi:alanine racemase
MIAYTVAEIAAIVSGKPVYRGLSPDYTVTQLAVDSRTLFHPGHTLFFALHGVRQDGHQFIGPLAEKGVKVFVVTAGIPFTPPEDGAWIETADALEALQRLAAYHRSRFSFPVIGITGSNGKTVVKEWLHDLLSGPFSVVRSPRSYNSQTGVPLSVWHLQEENTLALLEAGISQPGEMEKLETIIRPTLGVLTNIGDAHQENFSSLEQKTAEKLKLFIHSRKLVFSLDQGEPSRQAEAFCRAHGVEPITWSASGKEALLTFRLTSGEGNTTLEAAWQDRKATLTIPFTDASSIENCCQCWAVIVALEADPQSFTAGFSRLSALTMRLELKRGINQCLLLNDYYNSDINSLEIALSVLHRQAEKNHLEKIVILSDIRQSGLPGRELYGQVNRLLTAAGVETIVGIGSALMQEVALFTMRKQFYASTQEFIAGFRPDAWSRAAILIKGARDFRFEEISAVLELKAHQSVLEISLDALRDNLNYYRSLLRPETRVMAMVKAFSYGSGDVEIAKLLQFARVDYLAVAVTDEGRELRNAGITLPIIVMNPEHHSFQQMIDYRLEPNLYSTELVHHFGKVAGHNALLHFPVHLKIDTGMNRLGLKSREEAEEAIRYFREHPQLRLQSVFSHLAASEDPAMDGFTTSQISRFLDLTGWITASLDYPVDRHILNSAGIERFPEYQMEMVRLGIGLYGVSTGMLPLRPVGRLKSSLSQIKEVFPGETVGYNRAGKISRPSRIAIIPVGYADGLDRRLGNGRGKVYINGSMAPLVGNICMDMCMADVTGITCQTGDEAEFFGDHISISEVAAAADTIPYEILTGISQRIKRIYIQE